MGILSRIAKLRPDPHSLALGAADTTLGVAGGGMLGLANSIDDPENLGGNMGTGALLGGVGMAGGMGIKGIVMALAKKLKAARPDAPDEAIMRAAEQAVQMAMKGGGQ